MEATFKKQKLMMNDKEIKFVAAQEFNAKYGGLETVLYINIALKVLKKYPVDMLVFEMAETKKFEQPIQQVRLAGYDFNTQELDEETIVYKAESLETDKFWLKIDDYGDHYVGTFLFPHEY